MSNKIDLSKPLMHSMVKPDNNGNLVNYSKDFDNIKEFNFLNNRVFEQNHLNGYFLVFMTTPLLNLSVSGKGAETKMIDPTITDKLIKQIESGEDQSHWDRLKNEPRSTSADNVARSPIISQIFKTNRKLVEVFEINGGGSTTKNSLMPLITNFALGVDTKDFTMKPIELLETFRGYKMTIASHATESRSGGELSIPFYNDENLLIYNLHQIWFDYIDGVKLGKYMPLPDASENAYLDYMSSLYYFAFKPDMETLVYWCKFTGMWPSNIPSSIFSAKRFSIDPVDEISISYSYSYAEEMNESILRDFEMVSNSEVLKFKRDPSTGAIKFSAIDEIGKQAGYFDTNGTKTTINSFNVGSGETKTDISTTPPAEAPIGSSGYENLPGDTFRAENPSSPTNRHNEYSKMELAKRGRPRPNVITT